MLTVSAILISLWYSLVEQISIRKCQRIPVAFAEAIAFSDVLMSPRQGLHGNQLDFFPVGPAGFLQCPGFLNVVLDWIRAKLALTFLVAVANLETVGILNGIRLLIMMNSSKSLNGSG